MTAQPNAALGDPRESIVDRLTVHVRDPLHRNGYALVASTFATSVLGALYWAIVARRYSSHEVGINASLISSMMFLTNLASLNFTDVLNRFVPATRGSSTRRLVLGSYAVALGLGGVSATVFVLGARIWAPWLGDVLHGPWLGLVYVLATMLWVVFVLQDAVLVGLRRATYVLVENTGFGIVKIVLVVAFAAALPNTGIFLSWTAPLVLVVLAVSGVVFGRLIPRHSREPHTAAEVVGTRNIGSFLAADYVAAMSWTAAIAAMPVVVLKIDGASASAYVYLTWTICYTLYLVSRNMGMALTTEGVHDPGGLARPIRAALVASGRIVVPLAVALTIAAPLVLDVFGAEYSTHATSLMRLLALSTIPAIVPIVYVSAARVERRLAAMVTVTVLSSLPVLVVAPLLIGLMGIVGVGVAWLGVQSAVAVALLPGLLRGRRPAPAGVLGVVGPADAGDALPAPTSPPLWLVPTPGADASTMVEDALGGPVAVGLGLGLGVVPDLDLVPYREDDLDGLDAPAHGHVRPPGRYETDGRAPVPFARRAGVSGAVAATVRRVLPWWPVVTFTTATGLWVLSLLTLGPDPVGRYGLLSGLPVPFLVALGIVVAGTACSLRRDVPAWVAAVHIGLLVLMLHATAAIAYPELRYAWAWRHVGIVDLMSRHHAVVPGTTVLPIYQHWPGFFAAATALTEAGSFASARSFAAWSPPVFEMLNAAALAVALGALTKDRRRVALAVLLFVVANWIGQDYFAPQAFSYLLYLVMIGVVLRWYRRAPDGSTGEPRLGAPQRRTIGWLLVTLMLTIVVSHPLTPIVACVALALLALFRVLDRRWPAVLMLLLTVSWMVTGAGSYTLDNVAGLVSGFGRLGSNVGSNLANLNQLSAAQNLVSTMGRGVVVAVAALAVGGLTRVTRRSRFEIAPAILAAAPLVVLAGGSYGGEAVFRVYLFALPFACFLAAGLFFPSLAVASRWRTSIAITVVASVLVVGLLFAYLGKESWARFTPDEVRAAEAVFDHAPTDSLLIDGTGSYPTQFRNAEHFTYVSLATEPAPSQEKVLRHPVRVLSAWLSDPRFRRTYLILTRSQAEEVDATGVLPRGSIQRLRRDLVASRRFRVLVENRDALVLTWRPGR